MNPRLLNLYPTSTPLRIIASWICILPQTLSVSSTPESVSYLNPSPYPRLLKLYPTWTPLRIPVSWELNTWIVQEDDRAVHFGEHSLCLSSVRTDRIFAWKQNFILGIIVADVCWKMWEKCIFYLTFFLIFVLFFLLKAHTPIELKNTIENVFKLFYKFHNLFYTVEKCVHYIIFL